MIKITNDNIKSVLSHINVSTLSYEDWTKVGMALKDEGFPLEVWEEWSRNDSRYKEGECEKKWRSFGKFPGAPVTMGTIMNMAIENGFSSYVEGEGLDWDDEIGGKQDYVIVDKNWIQGDEITMPKQIDSVKEITTYLETLFDSKEIVGYVTETIETQGKYTPTKGVYCYTAGELISMLSGCDGDIGSVLGDYNEEAGAYIRFNPLDGKGVKNENVTSFRYCLVESDSMDIEKQYAIIKELELPVAVLVHSGGKSLHAITKIEADNEIEYRKRVDYLYNVCRKNGLQIDRQNRNPSRLSRLPGVKRKDKFQFIIDSNIGKTSFTEWKEWIESINDDLPEPENLQSEWGNLPELSPCLIEGVLRKGHKMLIAGPSKAGKSYALIELSISIAEGKSWFGFQCAKGKVMYVNLELDRASCLHRFKDVYDTLGIAPENTENIDIWNLRGKSIPMDKLAPKLIRRAIKKNYVAIILDPIYKIITGDENSADQMANFCNQFDKLCTELSSAVIYCHHHSKGAQGSKRSMDRASGSGVFARDPDALLDLIELPVSDALRYQQLNDEAIKIMIKYLNRFKGDEWQDEVSSDDLLSKSVMLDFCRTALPPATIQHILSEINEIKTSIDRKTAWRIEGTLREFPKFKPLNMWFDYPVHKEDKSGVLADIELDDGYSHNGKRNSRNSPYKENFSGKKTNKQRKDERGEALVAAFEACEKDNNGEVSINSIADVTGKSDDTVKRWVDEFSDDFYRSKGKVGRKK